MNLTLVDRFTTVEEFDINNNKSGNFLAILNSKQDTDSLGQLISRRLLLKLSASPERERWTSAIRDVVSQKVAATVVNCGLCSKSILARDLKEHNTNQCEMAKVSCDFMLEEHKLVCGAVVARKDLASHQQNECRFRYTSCPFVSHGCTFKAQGLAIPLHLSDNISAHMMLLCSRVENLSAELEFEKKQRQALEKKLLGSVEETKESSNNNVLTTSVRELVSKEKRRFLEDGYNLDLTYIKPNLIAMGFPSKGKEALYRNPADEVKRLLEQRHPNHYRIYNLCIEKKKRYKHNFFFNRVEDNWCGFYDHNPCPFRLLLSIVEHMRAYLAEDPLNVAVVHCKAGKGRTGLVLCAYMLYTNQFPSALEVLHYYGHVRTHDGEGVTIPSQIRYVHYLDRFLKDRDSFSKLSSGIAVQARPNRRLSMIDIGNADAKSQVLYLTAVRVCLYGEILDEIRIKSHSTGKETAIVHKKSTPFTHTDVMSAVNVETADISFSGDLTFTFFKSSWPSSKEHFHFWIHTEFITALHPAMSNLGLVHSRFLHMDKHEIDVIGKDAKNKMCPEGSFLQLFFSTKPFNAREASDRVEHYPRQNSLRQQLNLVSKSLDRQAWEICLRKDAKALPLASRKRDDVKDPAKRTSALSPLETVLKDDAASLVSLQFVLEYFEFKTLLLDPSVRVRPIAQSIFDKFFEAKAPLPVSLSPVRLVTISLLFQLPRINVIFQLNV